MGKFSFIGDMASTISKNAKTAKEVMESTGKSANKQAKMVKNCINTVQSNLGSGQAKAIAEMGEDSGRALKEGINNAVNQTKAKTAQKALDNHTSYKGNSAVQKSREIIESKKVNQVIDGHNAQVKANKMNNAVDKVKYSDRVPKDHETARQAIDNANQTVRKNLDAQKNVVNQYDPYKTKNGRRAGNRDSINTGEYKSARLIDDDNATVQNSPWSNNQQGPKQNFKEVNRPPDSPPEAKPNPFDHEAIEPEFDINNSSGGNKSKQKNSKTRERMNREFNGKFGEYKETAKDTFLGGIMDSYDNIRYGEQGIFEGIKNAHINDDGSMNWRRAAGTFATTSAAARIASGGGLYKDRYGNPNLIGVPFI